MKSYRLPLSEAFIYGSPERPTGGSYRWVGAAKWLKVGTTQVVGRRRHEPKRKT